METSLAIAGLSSLAHEGRLAIFRLLVRAGPEGLAAGEIADQLGLPASTLSAHLKVLKTAGLATARARERNRIYAIDFVTFGRLMGFLLDDCCQGRPEVCGPLIKRLTASSCQPVPQGNVQ